MSHKRDVYMTKLNDLLHTAASDRRMTAAEYIDFLGTAVEEVQSRLDAARETNPPTGDDE